MNVRLVNDPVLADYRAVWDQLYDSTDCEPSASCEWTEALIRSRRLAVDEVLLAVIEDGRAARGLLPLARSTVTKYGMSIRVLSPISELYNTHSELLVEREPAAAIVRAVFDALKSAHVEWDIFRMGRFFDGNPLVGIVGACAKDVGIRYLTRRHDPAFVLALDGTYDAYLKRRSSGFRNNLKRMAKKLAETGEARYRRADGSRSIEEEYQHVLDIEARSWKHERGTSIDLIPSQRAFYETLCSLAFPKKRLHLSFMELDGRPVVYHLGLIKNGTYHLLKTSYADAVKASGAATIAKARLVEDLIDSRMTRLDFGPELFEWKRVWADDIKWHTRLRAFNRTPAGYAAFAAEWLRSRALRRGEVDDVQYRNRRDLRGPEASTRASTPSMASR